MADIAAAVILMLAGAWLMLALGGLALVVIGIIGTLPDRHAEPAAQLAHAPIREARQEPITVGRYLAECAGSRSEPAPTAAKATRPRRANRLARVRPVGSLSSPA